MTDLLLGYAPFSTITLLLVIVADSAIAIPVDNPALVLVPVIVADLALNLYRAVRRLRRVGRVSDHELGATA